MNHLRLTVRLTALPHIERRCASEKNGKPLHLWRLLASHKDGDVVIYAYRFGTDSALGKLKMGELYDATVEAAEGVPSLLVLRKIELLGRAK